ncbi:MAG: ribosomal protein S18-alanine N-acetyltransferase [Gammaproteobacteria bacterium]
MSAVLDEPVINIRPMTEHDLDAVLAIEQRAYNFPWSETIFQDCLRVGYCCWLLEHNWATAAYSVMSVVAGECHLLNLCVNPDHQNQGLGQTMLENMLEIACSHGADVAFLEVRPSNHGALKLYNNAGFDEIGSRRDYYPADSGREDALILARSLVSNNEK